MSVANVEITDGFPAYFASAAGARRGVVIIHELFGLQPEIAGVADRFAKNGYAAVAPNLFSSVGCVVRTLTAMKTGRGAAVERVHAARQWLCERAGLEPTQVGIIGFCFGGGFALVSGHGFGAVSTNYGEVPPTERLAGLPPTIGCYGGRDLAFSRFAGVLEQRLTQVGVPHETHTYPEVGHSFLTNGHHPILHSMVQPIMHIEYRPEIAEAAFAKIFAFFAEHLA